MNLWLLRELSVRQAVSRSHSGFVRMVGFLSVAGIAIGVAALVILRSFMSGFTGAIRSSLEAVNPPIHVYAPGGGPLGPPDLGLVEELSGLVSGASGVVAVLERPAVASGAPGTVAGVMVRGTSGDAGSTVIGVRLAEALGVSPGDTIRLASAAGARAGAMGRILVDTIMPVMVEEVRDFGIDDYNRSLVSTSISRARALFRDETAISSIGVMLERDADPTVAAAELDSLLRSSFVDGGWPEYMMAVPFMSFHTNLFQALGLETAAMTVVLALITVVALLNLSSALTMIALERRRETGVLRAMGAPPAMVFVTSLARGGAIGAAGALAGVAAAWLSVEAVNRFFPIRLDGSVYWVETLAGSFSAGTALAASAATVAVCLLLSLAPAVSALTEPPAEALRYE